MENVAVIGVNMKVLQLFITEVLPPDTIHSVVHHPYAHRIIRLSMLSEQKA